MTYGRSEASPVMIAPARHCEPALSWTPWHKGSPVGSQWPGADRAVARPGPDCTVKETDSIVPTVEVLLMMVTQPSSPGEPSRCTPFQRTLRRLLRVPGGVDLSPVGCPSASLS
ncbi:hypothetical protein ABT120_22885 [Nonomuraea angiospora]|uniref:hypothetical protein n=1 Tax=Nonomuraea angiospora TaxID=46172 RepID=UPI003326843E